MKTTYCLVYQAGLANVFEEIPLADGRSKSDNGNDYSCHRVRVYQSSFGTCETFARGLRHAKKTVRVAWCNEAGDITNSFWHFTNFDNAPFSEKFAEDFVLKKELTRKHFGQCDATDFDAFAQLACLGEVIYG